MACRTDYFERILPDTLLAENSTMSLRLSVAFLLLLVGSLPSFAADAFPEFRGPRGDGTADAKGLPTQWSETQNIRWKVPVHGKGWSSPVVWGDQVWVTTADEVGGGKLPDSTKGAKENPITSVSMYALAFDRNTGKLIHDIKLGTQDKPQYCHPFNSYASPTPAIEEGKLYAHFGSLGTWCVDTATGKVVWERRDLKCDHFRGPASSPIIHDGKVYLIFDGVDLDYVIALDKATGKTAWKADRNIKYKSTNPDYWKAYATARVLDVNGKKHLVCPSAECTIAYDPSTGTELWRLTHGGMNGSARPIMGHGLMYLTSGHTGKLFAMKAESLAADVAAETALWNAAKNVPSRPSLLLVGDLLFMVSDGGIASCLDARTGSVNWSERIDGEYSSSPLFADGKIYVPNQTGKTFVLEAGKSFNPIGENKLDAGCMASPAAVGDALYLRTKTHLYCIGKK